MTLQNFEAKNEFIRQAFEDLRNTKGPFSTRLNLSWSNWGFGLEELADSARRLEKADLRYIELHGNHYGQDLGYRTKETLTVLQDHGLDVSGVCGMFSSDNDLSSNRPAVRQAAMDYLRRELAFTQEIGGSYLLVVPGAVGRAKAADEMEESRSVATLRQCAQWFGDHGINGAIEPIRAAEVSLIHTFEDAKRYIRAVDSPAISHINGDVYHMQSEESHIGATIVDAGPMLLNLHFADSNRSALGEGSLDVSTIIRALYVIGHNQPGRYVSFEPLGPGGDPYPAMYGRPDGTRLDALVLNSVRYFRECEDMVLSE